MKIFEQSKARIKASESIFRSLLVVFFLSLIFLFQFSDSLAAPSFGPNMLVSEDIGPFSSSDDGPPILDVDIASGVYVAWIDHRNSQTEVFFSKLTPNGSGFSSNKPLTGISDAKSFPQIEEDNGSIYVSWGERRIINNTVSEGIFFTKSTDGGQTFSEEIFVDSTANLPISMVAHDNKIFIAYSRGNNNQIWLAKSIDGGSTFATSIVSDSTDFSRHRPSVDFKNDNVYVSWFDERSGLGDVFFAKSTDGGATFSPNKSIYSNPNSAMHRVGVYFGRLLQKVSTEGQIYIAFDFFLGQDPSNFDFDVFFIKSSNEGETFSNALRLPDDSVSDRKKQISPSLTILPDDSPVIAWFDERDPPGTKTMLTYSQDKGQTFSANINISNTPLPNSVYIAPTVVSDREGKIHFVRGASILAQVGIWYTKIDLGIHLNIPPTPSPSPSPTPTPTPFLDLPWDYQSQGKTFDQVALDPNSWFDHKYPLQKFLCCDGPVVAYTGKTINKPYQSHNGYDYGWRHGISLNTPVLAAASGWATFVSSANSDGAGNVIKIDHSNGYQTWYEHLSGQGLVVSQEGQSAFVDKGQQIGKVGMTGNTTGPHIHFSVFKDMDGDGSFDDEFPFGATDPLGWEGEVDQDPWPRDKSGATSQNLFIKLALPTSSPIPATGGTLETGNVMVTVPNGASNSGFDLIFKNGPFEAISDFVKSISPSFFLNAYTEIGVPITEFSNPIKIIYNYSDSDLSNIKEDTLKLYYFNEQNATWNAIPTIIDTINKTVTGETTHFTQFALMGEVKDLIAPTTDVIITGQKGQENWYRTNVSVELIGKDDIQGLGLQYTLYTLNGNDWFEYKEPLVFDAEGNHQITYQSFDKADNRDERKTIEFNIDKTAPEAKIFIDQAIQDVTVTGLDDNSTNVEKLDNSLTKKKNDSFYLVSDLAGNTLKLDVRDKDLENKDKFSLFSLTYNTGLPFEQPKNQFKVIYKEESGQKYAREEKFTIKGVEKIKIDYDFAKNESRVISKEYGQDKVKEILPGVILLQLVTNQGNLEYSYQ